jgi:mono/diheme cytochrome c family protein
MLFALSTGHQIGLATTGGLFILFALVSSLILPNRFPNFPGNKRNLYLVVCVTFFVAMLAAVFVFGKEAKAKGEGAGTTTAVAAGDPVAGKAVFASSGCAACHTFKPAASTGKIGPDLDNLKASATKAGQPLDQFIATSITDPNAYIATGYQKGVMPTLPLTPKQVSDLVAFLSSGS